MASHEPQDSSVGIGDIHCYAEFPAVMDLAAFDSLTVALGGELTDRIDGLELESDDIESVQARRPFAMVAFAEPDDYARFGVGQDYATNDTVLLELVNQRQAE